ncbi:WxL domain-containing protein [Lapidilactobacillus salsurivasis]
MRKRWRSLILLGLLAALLINERPVQGDTLTGEAKIPLISEATTDPVAPRDPQDPDLPYPGDELDPANQGTGSTEVLSLDYASNLHFAKQTAANKVSAQLLNAKAMVQVTDQRGSGTGWVLQLKPEFLVGQQTGAILQSGLLDFKGLTTLKTTSDNVSPAPQLVTDQIYLGDYVNLVRASSQQGRGIWVLGLGNDATTPAKLTLALPAKVASDHYVGTLNWSLLDAPN